MKSFTSIASIIALVSAAEDCQCLSSTGVHEAATKNCCSIAGANPEGNQCPANRISNDMSKFAACCRDYQVRSDCRCPSGCWRRRLKARNEARGLPPPTEGEVRAMVAKDKEFESNTVE